MTKAEFTQFYNKSIIIFLSFTFFPAVHKDFDMTFQWYKRNMSCNDYASKLRDCVVRYNSSHIWGKKKAQKGGKSFTFNYFLTPLSHFEKLFEKKLYCLLPTTFMILFVYISASLIANKGKNRFCIC